MTVRLALSVEGPTEEAFAKSLLRPHLQSFNVLVTPVNLYGDIRFDRVVRELQTLLRGFADGYVTSLYDFYGFRGREVGETVDALQHRIADRLGHPGRLIPYIQLHEFEALLLSDAKTVAQFFEAPRIEPQLRKVVSGAGGPEAVNDSAETAPSKRLKRWVAEYGSRRNRQYDKEFHGPELARLISLTTIRTECPRFDAWLSRLEALSPEH